MKNDLPKKILMADDEETFLMATADLLKMNGYEIEIAGDSDSALDYLKQSRFDLLITDIKMPKVDGLELLEKAVAKVQSLLSLVYILLYNHLLYTYI